MIKVYEAVFGYKVKFHFSAKDQVDVHPGFVSLPGTCYYCDKFDQRPNWYIQRLILFLSETVGNMPIRVFLP